MIMMYLMEQGELPLDTLLTALEEAGPEVKEIIITTAEMLQAEGEARLLLKVLASRFGPVSAATEQEVRAAGVEQLEAWAERVFAAATVDEVLA